MWQKSNKKPYSNVPLVSWADAGSLQEGLQSDTDPVEVGNLRDSSEQIDVYPLFSDL